MSTNLPIIKRDPITGEDVVVPPPVDAAVRRAQNLDRRIRLLAGSINDTIIKLQTLVEEAKSDQIHQVLGYASWTAYLSDVFTIPVRLDRGARAEVVGYLSGEGMSQRAIAAVVGVDQKTVGNDLRAGEENSSPEPLAGAAVDPRSFFEDEEEMADCLAMGDLSEEEFESVLADARAQEDLSRGNVARLCSERTAEKKQIVGRDGKIYQPKPPRPQEPSKPRRGPITDTARSVGLDLGRINKRLEKLLDDDRFGRNREVIGSQIRPEVKFMLDVLGRLDGEINPIPDVSQYGSTLTALMRQTVSPYRLAQLHAADRRELLLIMREAVKELDHLEGGDQ